MILRCLHDSDKHPAGII
uniref:Uncharacterized protein n=1 Tax=Arundo donax TaxID=35708 RepID=A0A0A9G649_ARUDO